MECLGMVRNGGVCLGLVGLAKFGSLQVVDI
jgi:hypothetical protein